MLDFATQYDAFRRRDPSFDGLVFVAVRTTGVYCRPICPARTPLARNVRFFVSAAAAETAGFRPCLRCRPETAPFCPAWKGTQTTVERALALIRNGALDRDDIPALAEQLGIGSRHLSRLFAEHAHCSPLDYVQLIRFAFAKQLVMQSRLDLEHVASRAGFRSAQHLRRVWSRWEVRPPSAFRGRESHAA